MNGGKMAQDNPPKCPVFEENPSNITVEIVEQQHPQSNQQSMQQSNMSARVPDKHKEQHNTSNQPPQLEQPHRSSNGQKSLEMVNNEAANDDGGVKRKDSEKHCDSRTMESKTQQHPLQQKQLAQSENLQQQPQRGNTSKGVRAQQGGKQTVPNLSLTERDQKRNFLAGLIAGASTAGMCEASIAKLPKIVSPSR